MKIDAYACLVFTADWNAVGNPAAFGWVPGPLPIPLPASGTGARGGGATVTDRESRATYFAPRMHDLLYGVPHSPTDGAPQRWHLAVEAETPDINGSRIQAWELLFNGTGGCLTVAHVQLGSAAVASLSALTVRRGPGRDWLASSLKGPVELAGQRPRVLSHLLWEGYELPEPYESAEVLNSLVRWNTVERWQWFLAAGIGPYELLPDTEDPDLLDGKVWLSHDWRALVLRDGIAYVALTPRSPAEAGSGSFHDVARVYARSIYLDVLLLGLLQLDAVHCYAEALAAVHIDDEPVELAQTIEKLEAGLLRLRTGLWWRDVTRRGGPTTAVLNAFQRQHRLPDLYTQIVQDLTDMSRYVQARRASLEEADRQAREDNREAEERARQQAEDRQRQSERAIALITFVLLPVSLIFGMMSALASPSPTLFWVSFGVSAFILVVMLSASSTLRQALFPIRGDSLPRRYGHPPNCRKVADLLTAVLPANSSPCLTTESEVLTMGVGYNYEGKFYYPCFAG